VWICTSQQSKQQIFNTIIFQPPQVPMSTKSQQNASTLTSPSLSINNAELICRLIRKKITQRVLDHTNKQPYSTMAEPPDETDMVSQEEEGKRLTGLHTIHGSAVHVPSSSATMQ
jgi:hypothetical protein